MTSRAFRFVLLTLCTGLLVASAYIVWTEEARAATAAAGERAFAERVEGAGRALLDLRGAQAGYVAAGQGEDFWAARVDEDLAAAREALAALQAGAQTPEAQTDIEAAAEAIDDFEQMDKRARNYARNGQRLLASDLVFSDGFGKIDAALAAIDRAHDAERASWQAAIVQSRRSGWLTAAGAGAFTLLIMFMLAPLPGERTPPVVPARTATSGTAADSLPLRSAVDHRRAEPLPAPPPSPAPPPQAPPAVDLPGIASLCTDLARIVDMQALPAALERAATLLDARGIVIWIADPDGRELAPVLAHGYPQHLIARMGQIGRDAENVTAAAFRTGLVQTVNSDTGANGAIAAPLITPGGTVGVMAAELLHDSEQRDATRAAAVIVAAQLATLVGPPSIRSPQGATEAAGT